MTFSWKKTMLLQFAICTMLLVLNNQNQRKKTLCILKHLEKLTLNWPKQKKTKTSFYYVNISKSFGKRKISLRQFWLFSLLATIQFFHVEADGHWGQKCAWMSGEMENLFQCCWLVTASDNWLQPPAAAASNSQRTLALNINDWAAP